MFLSYGNHKHAVGECAIAIDRTPLRNAAHVPIAVTESWTITGMLTSQFGPTDLDAQIAALMDAYSDNGKDLVLWMPDGVTPSSSTLLAANTLGGTRVVQRPSFPGGQGAERVNFCRFTVKVDAELPIGNGLFLVDYHESLKLRGGVPVIGWLEPAVGLPIQQQFKESTTFKATQEGSATGYLSAPIVGIDVGLPIWPASILPQSIDTDAEAPERIEGAYKNYKVTWHYEFESLTPLVGSPTPWPLSI